MNSKCSALILIFILTFSALPFSSAFRIVTKIKPIEMPDGTLGYTYVKRYRSDSHALIDETSNNTFELNLREGLSMLNEDTFNRIFDGFHDGTYKFTLTEVEPRSYRLNEDGTYRCVDRCDERGGPKVKLILTLPDGRTNSPGFKADINKVSGDWITFGNVRYAITNIEVADFYENYIGDDRYYFPKPLEPEVVVDFCIVFKYKNTDGRAVMPPGSLDKCFNSIDELLAFLAIEYSDELSSSAGDVLVSTGPTKAQCEIDFERESDFLEVKARPKQDKWEEAVRMAKFNIFVEDEIEETRGPTLDLSGVTAEDTGNALFDSAYKFELISFSPKILTPDGSIVEREGIPDADIRITELNSGQTKHGRMDYHINDSELQEEFLFGGNKRIILRLYQDPAQIEMPYFVDERNNNCDSGCPLKENDHCKDAYVRFAMKVRLFEEENRYSWFMRTRREVQRLAQGPNLTINISDAITGAPLGLGSGASATISFNDPVTGERYEVTKDVLGGKVTFNAPISVIDDVPITVVITAIGYEDHSETILLDNEPYEASLDVGMQPVEAEAEPEEETMVSAKYVVFSYDAFKTFVDNYVPYFTGEGLPEVGDNLTTYPKDSYVAVYNALKEYRIFKLVDPSNGYQEIPFTLDNSFTGTVEYKGKQVPLDVVIKFEDVLLGHNYEARFFLPLPEKLAGSTVDDYSDLKVVKVNWRFTSSGLIESNWHVEDVQPGEW